MTPNEIKAIRARAGLTQSALADVLGLSGEGKRYIRYLEAGDRSPSGPIVRLLEMLDRGELPARYLKAASE